MVIWLASYPRSGNTLVRMVLHQCYGQDTQSVYQDKLLDNLGIGKHLGHSMLRPKDFPNALQNDQLYFVKTHRPYQKTRVNTLAFHRVPTKAIYIIRDGRDVVLSYTHYMLDNLYKPGQAKFDVLLQKIITGERPPGKWDSHYESWLKHRDVVFIKFEELIQEPVIVISEALEMLNLKLEMVGEFKNDFDLFNRKWPKFFRRGRINAWKEEMPQWAISLFEKMYKKTLVELDYELQPHSKET